MLEYTQWRNFAKVIDKAILACKNSGYDTDQCFAEVSKTLEMPNGGVKQVIDYELTRYACYLIVQNGDPRKKVIALGQTYFAIQTRRQEVADYFNQLDEENKRLVVRGDVKQWSKLVQRKLNIGASGGEFTPPEVETRGTPTCRSGRLDVASNELEAHCQKICQHQPEVLQRLSVNK